MGFFFLNTSDISTTLFLVYMVSEKWISSSLCSSIDKLFFSSASFKIFFLYIFFIFYFLSLEVMCLGVGF